MIGFKHSSIFILLAIGTLAMRHGIVNIYDRKAFNYQLKQAAPPSCEGDKYWKDYCTLSDSSQPKAFLELPDKIKLDYDLFQAFNRQRNVLGEGSFGIVKKVAYTDSKGNTISLAAKKMKPSGRSTLELTANEIKLLNLMGTSKYFPRLYGCSYNTRNELLVAQTLLSHDLDSDTFRNYLSTLSNHDSLKFYRELFKGMNELWKKGYAHSDFKPENVMTDRNNREVRIIDLGLAERNTNMNSLRGSPVYMSPNKFLKKGKIDPKTNRVLTHDIPISPKDDMYSMAISIAIMEAPKSYDQIFPQPPRYGKAVVKDVKIIQPSCFKSLNTPKCRADIIDNVRKVLEKLQYGKWEDHDDYDTMNFTTLICKIIQFDNFDLDYDQVIKVMDRLINESGPAQPKVEAQVAEEKRKQLEAAKARQELLEELEKKEQEKKKALEAKQKDLMELQKEAKDKKKQPIADKILEDYDARLAKLRQENEREKKELGNIKNEVHKEGRIIRRENEKAKKGSKVYRENQDLFQPVLEEKQVDLVGDMNKRIQRDINDFEMRRKALDLARQKRDPEWRKYIEVKEEDRFEGVKALFDNAAQVDPASKEKLPTSRDKLPSSRDKLPSSRDKLHGSKDKMPLSKDQAPAVDVVMARHADRQHHYAPLRRKTPFGQIPLSPAKLQPVIPARRDFFGKVGQGIGANVGANPDVNQFIANMNKKYGDMARGAPVSKWDINGRRINKY